MISVKHMHAQSRVKQIPVLALETGGVTVVFKCDSDGEDGKTCEIEVKKLDES